MRPGVKAGLLTAGLVAVLIYMAIILLSVTVAGFPAWPSRVMPLIAILPLLLDATLERGNGRFNPCDPHHVINAIFLGAALWVALTPFPGPDMRAPAAPVAVVPR